MDPLCKATVSHQHRQSEPRHCHHLLPSPPHTDTAPSSSLACSLSHRSSVQSHRICRHEPPSSRPATISHDHEHPLSPSSSPSSKLLPLPSHGRPLSLHNLPTSRLRSAAYGHRSPRPRQTSTLRPYPPSLTHAELPLSLTCPLPLFFFFFFVYQWHLNVRFFSFVYYLGVLRHSIWVYFVYVYIFWVYFVYLIFGCIFFTRVFFWVYFVCVCL
ncbi:hypothetical protein I3760_11G099500 [Carya illinoinensis]|nr:hypothetical protein I3760_11G099500 [Carya illinoinensis]